MTIEEKIEKILPTLSLKRSEADRYAMAVMRAKMREPSGDGPIHERLYEELKGRTQNL